jgi:hypothetical protein
MLERLENSDNIVGMETAVNPCAIGNSEKIEESIDRSKHDRLIRIARLAMLIECEGSITIGMSPPTKTRNRPALYPTVDITNTAMEIIDEARETLIDERVGFSVKPQRYSGGFGKRLRHDLNIHSFDRTESVLNLILPFLRSKKRQAEIVLAFVASRRKADPKSAYSEQEWRWTTEVRKLNGRQPSRKALDKARARLDSSDGSQSPRAIEYFTRYVAMCEELQNVLEERDK